MLGKTSSKLGLLLASALIVSCGNLNSGGSGGRSSAGGGNGSFSKLNAGKKPIRDDKVPSTYKESVQGPADEPLNLQNLLNPPNDNADIRVNKYLWEAALETLNFLPIEAADPFSGVVVMGWGRAPGSSTDFRATVLVQDPALEAGSLKVALQKRNGPASAETNRQIEDAILTRARQLRIRAAKRR